MDSEYFAFLERVDNKSDFVVGSYRLYNWYNVHGLELVLLSSKLDEFPSQARY